MGELLILSTDKDSGVKTEGTCTVKIGTIEANYETFVVTGITTTPERKMKTLACCNAGEMIMSSHSLLETAIDMIETLPNGVRGTVKEAFAGMIAEQLTRLL